MKQLIRYWKMLFVLVGIMSVYVIFTSAYYSDSVITSGNMFTTGISTPSDIIINEFLPNPVGTGTDADAMPGGEWVELYNQGNWSIDIAGWYLYDNIDSHALPVTTSNVPGGLTIVPAHGYLIVYRNGDSDFSLNNSGLDQIRLFTLQIPSGALVDSVTYSGTIDGKSWARVPDITGAWSNNHTPTPGGPNV